MKKFLIAILLLFVPFVSSASSLEKKDEVFKARVAEILEEEILFNSFGEEIIQQNIKLIGLEGERENKEFYFYGISQVELIGNNYYKIGDKILLLESLNDADDPQYYILDFIRVNYIYYLIFAFCAVLLLVGRVKALRSLISLLFSFLVIFLFIIPKILAGSNPLLVTILGSIFILFFLIYFTEGFRLLSHLTFISIAISLFLSSFLSWFFVLSANLSGIFSEEIASLANIGDYTINFQGLLLAGIIIGLLGVLDDVVIAQISTVEQLHLANKNQTKKDLFAKSYKVGISHISSMTNTLFLAYAGVSLPLLVLVVSGESVFVNSFDIINNQQIATEIVRTLAGSIGLVLSVPISTYLAVYWYKK